MYIGKPSIHYFLHTWRASAAYKIMTEVHEILSLAKWKAVVSETTIGDKLLEEVVRYL